MKGNKKDNLKDKDKKKFELIDESKKTELFESNRKNNIMDDESKKLLIDETETVKES